MLASWDLEGGPWEKSQTNEHWGEECLPSPSSGASAASTVQASGKSIRGTFRPWRAQKRGRYVCVCVSAFSVASRPTVQLMQTSLSPLERGVCVSPPPPDQLLQNPQAPTFQPLLKGQSLLPNCPSKALQLGREGKT